MSFLKNLSKELEGLGLGSDDKRKEADQKTRLPTAIPWPGLQPRVDPDVLFDPFLSCTDRPIPRPAIPVPATPIVLLLHLGGTYLLPAPELSSHSRRMGVGLPPGSQEMVLL